MKTVIWIACGIGLNIAAATLHGGSAPQAIMASGAAGTFPKLLLLAAGNICIWRGLRSAIRDLWGSATGKTQRKPQSRRFAEDPEPVSDFDADEAFARYMQQREAHEEETVATATPSPQPRPRGPAPVSAPSPVRGGFGRKVV
jgi:hypothetical protein